ncbi:MAG: insulinase family protein [Solobacterium sp.]|nr:insulinase family protein [Solobacterium sp.]
MTEINVKGFRVDRERPVRDCDGTLIEMTYEQTGTKIIWLKRDEENKTFAVTFKTTPENDTGVFHILEHSVLNGSRKYPVREPFVNLLKSSMKTFLNAMTYPDKTMYPVSSRNPKDFMNLVSVYLDAVFHPLVRENEKIFAQEGWHYEIRSEADEPEYKGVVFNEMKGAFASVDETIVNEIFRMLFRDNCYQYVSGGDPEKIPELSYEQFKAAHDRFYHPDNASIFLDGDLDIEAVLALISEYLGEFGPGEPVADIPLQKILPAQQRTVYYEIEPQEEEAEKTQFSMATIVGDYTDVEQDLAWMVLTSVLAGTNEAPLKKAILDAGLGQDVELDLLDGILQPVLILSVRNTDPEKIDAARSALLAAVQKLCDGELSHSQIHAALNQLEFQYREKKEPSGIIFAQSLYNSWLYGGDPLLYLDGGACFDSLRKKTDEGYFEALLQKTFLSGPLNEVTALPSKELGAKRREAEKERLQKIAAGWSAEEKKERIRFNQELDVWQATPDSPEAAATIPTLSLSDIAPEPRRYEPEVSNWHYISKLQYPRTESGIVYWNLYFNLAGIRRDDLSGVSLFARLLTQLPTARHTVAQLQEEIQGNLGVLSFSVESLSPQQRTDAALPVLQVSVSMLEKNAAKARELILEVLQETVFTKETVQPLVQQYVESMRQAMISAGHSIAMMRTSAMSSAAGAGREFAGGYSYAMWQKKLSEDPDMMEAFLNDADMFREILVNKNRLTVSITGEETLPELDKLVMALPVNDFQPGVVRYPLLEKRNEGIAIPAQIFFGATAADMGDYDGALRVFGQIATYDYLWNEVRVKGGAYGTGFSINPNGMIGAYSYRDPDPANALKAFRSAGPVIRDMGLSEGELESYIIGTISNMEPLQSPMGKVLSADVRWLSGMTWEDRCRIRAEVLHTTSEQLQAAAAKVSNTLREAPYCIVGSRDGLQKFAGNLTILGAEEE